MGFFAVYAYLDGLFSLGFRYLYKRQSSRSEEEQRYLQAASRRTDRRRSGGYREIETCFETYQPITDSEVEIYELPTSFTRADLEKLEATKRAMREDSDKYVEEHSGDIAPTIDELMNSADTPKKKDDADTDDAADKKNKKKNKK